MLKSERSIIRTGCLDFWSFGSFDRSDFGIHSIRMPIMPKSEHANPSVRISDDIFCPKSKQIVRILALFSVRTKSSTEQRGSVRNPNTFGFQHSTVCTVNVWNPNMFGFQTHFEKRAWKPNSYWVSEFSSGMLKSDVRNPNNAEIQTIYHSNRLVRISAFIA